MPQPRYLGGRREGRKLEEHGSMMDPEELKVPVDWTDHRKRWERTYAKTHFQQKKYGTDRTERMYRRFNQEEVSTEIDPKKEYTQSELMAISDAILREDAKAEMCPECGGRGSTTGLSKSVEEGISDQSGNELALSFDEYSCPEGHVWFSGEGKERGIGGDNPILFEEHFQSRKRREIYTAQGTPDPSIVSGMYNRVHPQGRKVNSKEQRQRNGASFYR